MFQSDSLVKLIQKIRCLRILQILLYFGHNLQIIQLRLGKAKVCMVRSIPEGLGPKWGEGGR